MVARNKVTRELHRKEIARRRLEGWTQQEIADDLGISQKTVSLDIKALQKKWVKEAQQDFTTMRAEKAKELQRLQKMYYEMWYRSLKPSEKTARYVNVDSEGNPIPARVVMSGEEQIGSAAALQGAERIWEKAVRLFGLDAPELIQLVTPDFDQSKWHSERNKRMAEALKTLEDAEGLEFIDEDVKPES